MILNQPFPASQEISRTLRFTFYSGCVVFLILVLFQPFGYDKTPPHYFFRNAFFFGLATFIVATANALLLPALFPRAFDERTWTVSRELGAMVWQVVTISFVNLLLFKWLYNEEAPIITVLGITAAVGIFPITLTILLKQYALLKKYGRGANLLDRQIQEQHASNTTMDSSLVTIPGDNQNETVTFSLDDFRFISSADNYIKLHFVENDELAQRVLRSTLKKSEEHLAKYDQVFRCHRTYIVNLAAVEHVSGNAQGFKLRLRGVNELIPVSRNLNKELTSRLQSRPR
jgi:DNA-binding LytR/AlgR family response regulator